MKLKRLFGMTLVTAAVLSGSLTQAKGATIVVERDGDLYLTENDKSVRLTTYGHNLFSNVSPDGRWVAYLSSPNWKTPAPGCIENGGGGQCWVYNVWLMNLRTQKAWKLGGQAQDTWNLKKNISRAVLLWSPDSRHLAWFECSGECDTGTAAQMRVANVATQQVRPVSLAGSRCSGFDLVAYPVIPSVFADNKDNWPVWGAGGIAAFCDNQIIGGGTDGGRQISVIRPAGQHLSFPVPTMPYRGSPAALIRLHWHTATILHVDQIDLNKSLTKTRVKWQLDTRTGQWGQRP